MADRLSQPETHGDQDLGRSAGRHANLRSGCNGGLVEDRMAAAAFQPRGDRGAGIVEEQPNRGLAFEAARDGFPRIEQLSGDLLLGEFRRVDRGESAGTVAPGRLGHVASAGYGPGRLGRDQRSRLRHRSNQGGLDGMGRSAHRRSRADENLAAKDRRMEQHRQQEGHREPSLVGGADGDRITKFKHGSALMYHSLRTARLAAALLFLVAAPAWAQNPIERLFGMGPGLPDAISFRVQMEAGNLERARTWLDAGLDPNYLGDKVGSGLMIAAREGNLPLMELFVARGADVNLANSLGETALMHAAWKGKLEAVRWLLAHGARVNQDGAKWSALHYAVFAGNAEVASLLLENGADINARSPNGSSVLMMAVYEGREEMVRWALAHGADTSAKNENGDGALEWAMKFDQTKIARMVSTSEDFRAAASRPKADWGQVRRSEAVPPDVADLLRIRELLVSRNLAVDKVDRRIAALRAKYARESLKKQAPPPRMLEITAERQAPERQEVRLVPWETRPR